MFTTSPVRWQPLEDELRPVLKYLKGVTLNAGCGNRDISSVLGESENCDIESTLPGAIICELTDVPKPDESYDSILANAVLEHVRDCDGVVKELRRLLKPGGHMVLAIPFLQPYHATPTDYRRFTREGLEELGRAHELEVVEIIPVHSIAQTVGWILWEYVKEKRPVLRFLFWPPIRLWTRLSQKTDFSLAKNANTFQIVLRKHRP